MKIISVVGARPQFIKAAVVSRALKMHNRVKEKIIHTGQHFDKNMSEIFFREMKIPKPAWNLGIDSLSHGAMTGRMIEAIEKNLLREMPDCVIVYGDTNSTLAGALAAKKLHIQLAHVEAGLRSYNLNMPEEINRILTDRISDFLFCPTIQAVSNLKSEGFEKFNCKIVNSGDVMYDAALYYSALAKQPAKGRKVLPGKYILCTIHRAENTDDPGRFYEIIDAINDISRTIPVIVPMHPRTRKIIADRKVQTDFRIIDPVGYLEMIGLIKNSILVMTDSGGLQKEAYFFKKSCITLRDETEWTELVKYGYNTIAGHSRNKILNAFRKMMKRKIRFSRKLYGDGTAGEIIAKELVK